PSAQSGSSSPIKPSGRPPRTEPAVLDGPAPRCAAVPDPKNTCRQPTLPTSSGTPGPIVVESVTRLRYVPLAAAGRERFSAAISDIRFSLSASGSNELLPI